MHAASAPKMCLTCGARYSAEALFCPADGTPLTHAAHGARGASDPGTDPYLGREIGGHIEIRQLAGVGAMGRVYRAFQRGIDRDVAVKILHRELSANAQLVARFHREAKVASRLQHPNVVQVHLAGQLPDGALYIVMEYLDGLSLQSALAAAGGAMPLARALHIGLQLCDAAGEAHAQGVVHRDLKPENVMLVHRADDPDTVKVLDFGIARLNWGEQSMATAAGLIFGTARYISPEGAQGEQVGPPSDVYSIATLVYQMLAGRTPFEGDQAVGLLVQQIHEAPPHLKAIPRAAYVPDAIAGVLMRNLAKDPAARMPDGRALGRALLEAAVQSGLSTEDLVARSVLLGARASVMHLPPMQRTKQLQLDASIADLLAPPPRASSASLPSATPAPRTEIATSPPAPPTFPEPSAPTRKWTPPPAVQAQLATAAPSGLDVTLDERSATPAPALPETVRLSPAPLALFAPTATVPLDARSPVPPYVPPRPPAHTPTPASRRDLPTHAGDDAEPAESGARRGLRWIGLVLLCFLLGVGLTGLAAYKMNAAGVAKVTALDTQVARANDALRAERWDAPPGDNVRDLVSEGLARWPHDPRLVDLRERAVASLVKTAEARRDAGDRATALHLAALARDLDPTDAAAERLVAALDADADAGAALALLTGPDAGATAGKGTAGATTYRAVMDIAPAKPRVGQPVSFVVKVASTSGTAPKKPLDGPLFQIGGPAIGTGEPARLPAAEDGPGVFRASFTFLAPGKYEVTFLAREGGALVKTSRPVVTADDALPPAPVEPRPDSHPEPRNDPRTDRPPPAPSASVKWL